MFKFKNEKANAIIDEATKAFDEYSKKQKENISKANKNLEKTFKKILPSVKKELVGKYIYLEGEDAYFFTQGAEMDKGKIILYGTKFIINSSLYDPNINWYPIYNLDDFKYISIVDKEEILDKVTKCVAHFYAMLKL